ncbi:FRG domain-containing protein [Bradyrhizobium jicamae]|uniref:FRG domain-containing protein n=1 Tax=Bradyrhizobium jicamae TaxID=280332 RepID=UPI001BAE4822|nr:FRG domain-containing protein [Bradyrhizobium jicamae]MBR0757803.1 FRG domain-containing protein [Bradyrhizobium jicamae]
MRKDVSVIEIDSWKAFRRHLENDSLRSWAFRGQANAEWNLFSTLSRYLMTFGVHPKAWVQQESRILRIFRRKAHLLTTHLPLDKDSLEWLAFMQHHGAPTRLLDFTWSPYVAAFFALERATADAAVWAICPPLLNSGRTARPSQISRPGEIGPWIKGNYENYFLPGEHRVVVIGEPHRMNERLVAQSGTFLMPGRLDEPVETTISEQYGKDALIKFVLRTKKIRAEAMERLYAMNITNATLFPGIDGLARSLAYELEFHWAFNPRTNVVYPGYRNE